MRHSSEHASGSATDPQRRRFLRNLGLGTAAAGAAASLGHVTFVKADESDDTPVAVTATGYRETEHVRAFYATLRD